MRYKDGLYLIMLIMATSCGEKTAAVANGNGNKPGMSDLVSPEKITPIQQIPTFNVNEVKCKAAALKIPRRYLLSKSEDLNFEENRVLPEEVDFFTKKELGEFKFTVEGDFDRIAEAKVTLNGKELEVKISEDGKEFSAIIDKTGRVEARVTRAIKGAEQRIVKMTPKVFVASEVDTDKIAEEVIELNRLDKPIPEDYVLLYVLAYIKVYKNDIDVNALIDSFCEWNGERIKKELIKYFSAIKENDDILLDLYSVCQITKIKKNSLKDSLSLIFLSFLSTTFDCFEKGDFQKLTNYLYFTSENFFEKGDEAVHDYFLTALIMFFNIFSNLKINNIEKTMEIFNKIGLNAPIEFQLPDIFDENYDLINIPSLKEILNIFRTNLIKISNPSNFGYYIYELDEINVALFEKNCEAKFIKFVLTAMLRMVVDYKEGYIEDESWLKIFQQICSYQFGKNLEKLDSSTKYQLSKSMYDGFYQIFSENEQIAKKAIIPCIKIVSKFLEEEVLDFDLNVLKFISLLFNYILPEVDKAQVIELTKKLFANKTIFAEVKAVIEREGYWKFGYLNNDLKEIIKEELKKIVSEELYMQFK